MEPSIATELTNGLSQFPTDILNLFTEIVPVALTVIITIAVSKASIVFFTSMSDVDDAPFVVQQNKSQQYAAMAGDQVTFMNEYQKDWGYENKLKSVPYQQHDKYMKEKYGPNYQDDLIKYSAGWKTKPKLFPD